MQVLSRYTEKRLFSSILNFSCIKSYVSIVAAEQAVLYDFIQLMNIELTTDPTHCAPNHSSKYYMNISFCTPPRVAGYIGPGFPSILVKEARILAFIQLAKKLPPGQLPDSNHKDPRFEIRDIPLMFIRGTGAVQVLNVAMKHAYRLLAVKNSDEKSPDEKNQDKKSAAKTLVTAAGLLAQLPNFLPYKLVFSTATKYLMDNFESPTPLPLSQSSQLPQPPQQTQTQTQQQQTQKQQPQE